MYHGLYIYNSLKKTKIMGKYFIAILCVAFMLSSTTADAQVEIKINPIGILFGAPDVSAEFILSDNLGIEAKPGFVFRNRELLGIEEKSRGFSIAAIPKYYFNPQEGADRFYAGLYARFASSSTEVGDISATTGSGYKFSNTRLALGVLAGFKWVGNSGVLLDINLGVGRALLNKNESDDVSQDILDARDQFDLDGISTIAIGYRF